MKKTLLLTPLLLVTVVAALTAYAAVNTLRLDDMNPHIYRTHDGGKTW